MVFKGELTKHILKCYPAGRAQDKRPVPNELSMLIFYLQTRPAKIPKAANMLSTRAAAFSTKENSGNFEVTVLIMHEIVRQLHNHFSLFAERALDVIDLAVEKSRSDESFLGYAEELYADYNTYHNGVLFAGNTSFSDHFLEVVSKFVMIAQKGNVTSRVLALKAIISLADSPALATKVGQNGVITAITGLEANIPHDPAVYAAVTKATKKSVSKEDDNKDPEYYAVRGLEKFLDTSSLEQITGIVSCILKWLSASSGDWQPQLVAHLAKWVPSQNRFVVTKTTVAAMSSLPIDKVKQLGTYSTYLNALLTEEESKIGLSVVDVLRKLLRLQHRLIESPPSSVDNQSIQKILVRLRENIGNLVNTNVYPGQNGDMIADILLKYSTTPSPFSISSAVSLSRSNDTSSNTNSISGGAASSGSATSTPLGILINDFRVLLEILDSTVFHDHDQRKLNISLWEGTQWILTSHHPQLLVLYTTAFGKFLEFSHLPAHPSSKEGTVIVRQLSDLSQQELPLIGYVALYYCILSLIKFLGAESKFMVPWLLCILPTNSSITTLDTNVAVCRSSVGSASLLGVFRTLNIQNQASELFKLIGREVERNLWLPGITYPSVVSVDVAISSLVNVPGLKFATNDSEQNSATYESIVSLVDLENCPQLSSDDIEYILHPPFKLDSPVDTDDTRSPRRKQTDSSLVSGMRSCSGNSHASIISEAQAPRIRDLQRRQTDVQKMQAMKSSADPKRENRISLPAKRESTSTIKYTDCDILSLIDNVNINGTTRAKGNLTL